MAVRSRTSVAVAPLQRLATAAGRSIFSAGVNAVGKHSLHRIRALMSVPCIGESHPMHVKNKTDTLVVKEKGVSPGVLHLQVPVEFGLFYYYRPSSSC